MIHYRLLPDGAFVVGDEKTGLTCYAFPTSPSADKAKLSDAAAAKVAREMLACETQNAFCRQLASCREFDLGNWRLLKP